MFNCSCKVTLGIFSFFNFCFLDAETLQPFSNWTNICRRNL